MNAKEMFESLGYEREELRETRNDILTSHFVKFYKYDESNNYGYYHYFNLIQESYMFNFLANSKVSEAYIPIQELQAIALQMKELMWIE